LLRWQEISGNLPAPARLAVLRSSGRVPPLSRLSRTILIKVRPTPQQPRWRDQARARPVSAWPALGSGAG